MAIKPLVQSAVKRGDKVITGKRHFNCIQEAINQGWRRPVRQDEQGFVDEDGVYYPRFSRDHSEIDAKDVAVACEQIEVNKVGVLLSEDLW